MTILSRLHIYTFFFNSQRFHLWRYISYNLMKHTFIVSMLYSYTSGFRFIEEDASHLIIGVQDVQRVFVTQVTRFRTFVVSCQCGPAALSFFVKPFNALYF